MARRHGPPSARRRGGPRAARARRAARRMSGTGGGSGSMYIRCKRKKTTVFLLVEPTDTVLEVKAKLQGLLNQVRSARCVLRHASSGCCHGAAPGRCTGRGARRGGAPHAARATPLRAAATPLVWPPCCAAPRHAPLRPATPPRAAGRRTLRRCSCRRTAWFSRTLRSSPTCEWRTMTWSQCATSRMVRHAHRAPRTRRVCEGPGSVWQRRRTRATPHTRRTTRALGAWRRRRARGPPGCGSGAAAPPPPSGHQPGCGPVPARKPDSLALARPRRRQL